jgi:hypothetical protein
MFVFVGVIDLHDGPRCGAAGCGVDFAGGTDAAEAFDAESAARERR